MEQETKEELHMKNDWIDKLGWTVVLGGLLIGVGLILAIGEKISENNDLMLEDSESNGRPSAVRDSSYYTHPEIPLYALELEGMADFNGNEAAIRLHNNSEQAYIKRVRIAVSGADTTGAESEERHYQVDVDIPPMSTRESTIPIYKSHQKMEMEIEKAWGELVNSEFLQD